MCTRRRAGRGSPRAFVAAVISSAALCAGCAESTGSAGDFHAKVTQSAKDAQSAVASAQLIAQETLHGKATGAYADTVVTDAENDVDSIQTTLDTRQPHDEASSKLRDKFDTVLQQAVQATEDLRIAIRRGDRSAIRQGLSEAAKAVKQLQEYSQ